MGGPEKPFACPKRGCGETFTNEDRLSVHEHKHDMELQLGNKGGQYVADQTPTPTRFIRNCEEVGLFQDLQNVNPFDETFKRAMEARTETNHLTLDGLTTTVSDDTLHTPHIFPHLPEDNPLYSGSSEHRSNMTVTRLSSDDGSNQLSVVKCMSSSVEDHLPSVCLSEKEDEDLKQKIQKRTESEKIKKLVRQEPVDIVDNLDTENIKTQSKRFIIESQKNVCVKDAQNLKIPIISISESSNVGIRDDEVLGNASCKETLGSEKESQTSQDMLKKDYLLAPKDVNIDFNSIKSNFNKLISQKSIDRELYNLTHETHNKPMDLNNISIESLRGQESLEISTVEKDSEVVEEVVSNPETLSHAIKRRKFSMNNCRDHTNIMNKDGFLNNSELKEKEYSNETNKQKLKNFSKQIDANQRQVTPNDNQFHVNDSSNHFRSDRVIPTVENIGAKVFPDATDKGYELLLKWPDGKKVYLKEVFREGEDAQNEMGESRHTSNTSHASSVEPSLPNIPETNSVIISTDNINVKQKLKKTIQNNAVRKYENKNAQPILQKIPIPSLHSHKTKLLPENYIIYPQISPNIQYLPVVTPQNNVKQTYLLSNNVDLVCQSPEISHYTELCNTHTINNANSIITNNTIKEFIPTPYIAPFKKDINSMVTIGNATIDSMGEKVMDAYTYSKMDTTLRSINLQPLTAAKSTSIIRSNNTGPNKRKSIEQKTINPTKKKTDNTLVGESNKNKDPIEVTTDIKERNKAAVFRYRSKKLAESKKVQEKNSTLEKVNELLRKQLMDAVMEIKQLRSILLLHTNCSVSRETKDPISILNIQTANHNAPIDESRIEQSNNQALGTLKTKTLP